LYTIDIDSCKVKALVEHPRIMKVFSAVNVAELFLKETCMLFMVREIS
jgi:hypothetical protein